MALIGTFTQQPAELLDYDINYTDWLAYGDTLASAAATVSPVGLTVNGPILIDTDRRVKVIATGGVSGVTYKIEVTATTATGLIKQDEIKIRVREV